LIFGALAATGAGGAATGREMIGVLIKIPRSKFAVYRKTLACGGPVKLEPLYTYSINAMKPKSMCIC
jgi:hypothetical protein